MTGSDPYPSWPILSSGTRRSFVSYSLLALPMMGACQWKTFSRRSRSFAACYPGPLLLYPTTSRISLLVKRAFNRNFPLPHQVLRIPLTNYVIMTGGDVHLVQRLKASGYPLQLPLPIQGLLRHIWWNSRDDKTRLPDFLDW